MTAAAALAFCGGPRLRAATVDLPVYGFSMDALEAPVSSQPVVALMTFLPASDGFSPNINVDIQPYSGTIRDYAALSRDQFDKAGYKIVSEQAVGTSEWDFEYTGTSGTKDLHFYARAISSGGKVFLVTATATETQWQSLAPTLRRHVDSFAVK